MRVPTRAGVLAATPGSAGAAFVVSRSLSIGAGPISVAGCAANDYALVVCIGANTSSLPAGWVLEDSYNTGTTGEFIVVAKKKLTAGDISTGSVTWPASVDRAIMAVFYSGVSDINVRSSNLGSTAAVITLPGVTKSVGSKGMLAYAATIANVTTISAPGTVTSRIAKYNGNASSQRFDDILNVSNYVDGTALTYTANTVVADAFGQLLELT